ncbi:hypothetical protein B0H16DRAFT_1607604 [Mycena metata]|uniref:Uncharacterized protein n=1 Tax=Mycena metata TaxID=1033252 RepID=A0AAD7HFE7_9AGAR|nr:hypothetical protein B0H16DRAFT_1607604 [Mycena metata]
MPPRNNTPTLPTADAGRPCTCAATGSTRNTPTGTNAQLPSSRPTSVAIPGDTPQASPTKTAATTQVTDPAHTVSTAAPSAFLQPVGAVAGRSERAHPRLLWSPPPPSATANRDTINLVSPEGSAIHLVSPTALEAELKDASESNHNNRGVVCSPPITSVPLASLVARAADIFDAGADISTTTAALTIDTTNLPAPTDTATSPPLPPPGEEVMHPDAAAARHAAKDKGKNQNRRSRAILTTYPSGEGNGGANGDGVVAVWETGRLNGELRRFLGNGVTETGNGGYTRLLRVNF